MSISYTMKHIAMFPLEPWHVTLTTRLELGMFRLDPDTMILCNVCVKIWVCSGYFGLLCCVIKHIQWRFQIWSHIGAVAASTRSLTPMRSLNISKHLDSEAGSEGDRWQYSCFNYGVVVDDVGSRLSFRDDHTLMLLQMNDTKMSKFKVIPRIHCLLRCCYINWAR